MATPGSTTVSESDTSHPSSAPKPERISATVTALPVIGFSTWVLLNAIAHFVFPVIKGGTSPACTPPAAT
ncbi:MAG TPA: hypothetical protein VFA45_19230 [Actinomycetes bacterium]|nr:hypothetical protein [Actinomycetes bacterium]